MSLAPVVLSLCDYSGAWAAPYREAGYLVHCVDLKHGEDVRLLPYQGPVRGVLVNLAGWERTCIHAGLLDPDLTLDRPAGVDRYFYTKPPKNPEGT